MKGQVIFDCKNILVVGGAGFIGSHLCDELIKENKVICLDNFSTGAERNIDHLLADPNFAFVRHDITKPIDLKKLKDLQKFKLQFQGIQEVYNLACPTSPKEFQNNRVANLMANSFGVKNVLDIVMRNQAKLVHFSSGRVYGEKNQENKDKRVREDDIESFDFLSQRSAHDEGKRFAEALIDNYRQVYNIDAKILRPFRVYGPRMKLNDNRMIPDFVNDALDNKEVVIPGDENFSSSFCYVRDMIDAALKMMASNVSGPLNIGSDLELTVKEVAQKVIDLVGSDSSISFSEKDRFITPFRLPDINAASNKLGWMPISTLDKGLEQTVDDLRASKGLRNVEC